MYILLIFVRILTLIVATSETFKTQMNNLNSNSTNLNLDNLEGEIEIIKDSPTSTTSSVNKPSVNSPSSVWSKMFLSVPKVDDLKPHEWISKKRETLKPWSEFLAFNKFKAPSGFGQSTSRLIGNINHFQSNYVFVFGFLAVYCILTSPYLLFAFMGMLGAFYIIHLKSQEGLNLFGKSFSAAQLYCLAGVLSVPLFLMAGGGSAVFWIIGASMFVIVMHAIFYSREAEDPFQIQSV